ncbi:MAG: DUF499 domain-containing protein [Clostridiales bacterium]|nr:DUF499 domain-containing protein [Clostridiales bacterium]
MPNNQERINQGFNILRRQLADYICMELSKAYSPNRWWREVRVALNDQLRDLPTDGEYGDLVDSLDTANCLRLLDRRWNEVFRKKLPRNCRTWGKELMSVRNDTAHVGGKDFDNDYTWRALDTMSRLCEAFDDEAAEEIRSLARTLLYGSAEGSKAATSVQDSAAEAPAKKATSEGVLTHERNLPSWRTIMEPHPDVAQGRYKNAEFAANLAQVAKGEGAFEYRDPVEFFARTYVTEGMKGLLVQALKRVTGQDGEPVIQLKTAFGGGKTHSMLALYHLLRGKVPASKLAGVQPVLAEAGITEVPKVKVAVLVGTALEPTKSHRPQDMPGITINTLWGEMAYQLAKAAGKPELYNYVKESDKKGVSPGHETLRQLFDACGPCLILMDELVAYAKKIYGVSGLPAGSFDNFISFIQEITEAASISKNSLVVASIPESDIEIGGEAGALALEAIEHTFGRMESIWKPVSATEGFEVVRRRLFLDCKDPAARDAVCEAFSRMYQDNPSDFPVQAREVEYKERMISCYPIHPEVFDHLYEEWSTLERFQRTRGVLRLMAAVIHELWMSNDASPMIMAGSLPMDVPTVRDELTRYLSEEWNGIVDKEVDGKKSVPYLKDKTTPRYGSLMASRRLARTIFLGSAPTDRTQSARGIEKSRIRFGTIQPDENIAVFNDALNTLQGSFAYLYATSDRYWYDTRPTLRKTMEDRATQLAISDVEFEIERRLKDWRKEAPFAGLHICPASSLDVPDEQAIRLVILDPKKTHRSNSSSSPALTECENILNNRGSSPRIYRNMLVFLAPDQTAMTSLMTEVRRWLAWRSIYDDRIELNLDAAQIRETETNLARSNDTVKLRLTETYCWLLAPYIDIEVDNRTICWEEENIRGGNDTPIAKVRKKLESNEALITHWSPSLLLMKLEDILWQNSDDIQIKKLWEYFCTYCYLPRLSSFAVLEECILSGVNSDEYFAYAEGVSDGRYLGLKYKDFLSSVNEYGYLVKIPVALKQIVADQAKKTESSAQPSVNDNRSQSWGNVTNAPATDWGGAATSPTPEPVPEKPQNTHFFLSTPLNITRINKDVNNLVQEVINQLAGLEGAKVEITLDVNAELPDGAPVSIVRSVTENCHTLKIRDFGFSE